tara:strand:- start:387 stop:539 length:153 start_codon:yes stop_codon:yes gene_type:complete
MGEWISNNLLLPVMYFLVDVALLFIAFLSILYAIEKTIDNKVINKILRRK